MKSRYMTYEFPNGIEVNPARVAFIKSSTGVLATIEPEPVPEPEPIPDEAVRGEVVNVTNIIEEIRDEFDKIKERENGYSLKPSITFYFSGLPGDYVVIEFSTRGEMSKSLADYKRAAKTGSEY